MADINELANRIDALNGTFTIRIDTYGRWYATLDAEVKSGGILLGLSHHADTVENAVCGLWSQMTAELKHNEFIVINASDPGRRRHYRWHLQGSIWKEIL